MVNIMENLEPRKEENDVILIKELDEFNEVIFFIRGTYIIGYSINHIIYYLH